MKTIKERVLEVFGKRETVRHKDLVAELPDINTNSLQAYLNKLFNEDLIERVELGTYRLKVARAKANEVESTKKRVSVDLEDLQKIAGLVKKYGFDDFLEVIKTFPR